MEERKRPASYDNDDTAPPHKKHVASSVNGNSKSHQDSDIPGKDDLERFQKEAIYRQMQEYKREKATLEARLTDITKRSAYHDDHLRAIDAWLAQLLDEVKVLANTFDRDSTYAAFPSTLLSADNTTFEKHLKSRSSAISSAITLLFANSTPASPEVLDLQTRIAKLLSVEKSHVMELEKSRLEKEQMEERLETASMRYMVAEKKLDRARSVTVAKLERQAIAGGRSDGGTDTNAPNNDQSNGKVVDSEALAEIETARKAAVAVSEKQKEQLEQLAAENEKLSSQLTTLNIKLSHLTDDDYARTDLFKHLKSQHEDVIKRINDLEATNVELREEAEKLQAERTSCRVQLEAESQAAISEKELQLSKIENDLARIRNARDELTADLQVRKAANEEERASANQSKQLAAAREERIAALESEVERLRMPTDSSDGSMTDPAMANLGIEELRSKYATLDRQFAMLKGETAMMEAAYKKTQLVASAKVEKLTNLEEKVMRLGAEKARADQKYFGAMKAKDAREQEVRTLRTQNSKSSDIVSQLKDAEASTRALAVNLEKHVAEAKEALSSLTKQQRATQQLVTEKSIQVDGLKGQIEELKKSLVAKDGSLAAKSSSCRAAELEIAQLKAEAAEMKKRLETWQSKGVGNENEHHEALRNLAICTICHKNFKDTVLKACGHVFCRDCVEDRLQNRMRKCPNCNKGFGASDHMRITL